MSSSRTRVVVLISGSGSNLQALIDGMQKGELPIEIAAVISNRPAVLGLMRAEHAGIPALVLDHKQFDDRESFDQKLAQLIDSYQPIWWYSRVLCESLPPRLPGTTWGRMLNIHPSLLPKYQGLNTHQRVLDAGDIEHGVTVHFVTEELDGGPAVIQAKISVAPEDDAVSLAKRVQQQEHIIYPLAVKWYAEGRLRMRHDGVLLDNELLSPSGYLISA